MIWFNPAKRRGFIQTDEGERLRVDESGSTLGTLVPLMAAPRARMRGRR